METTMTTTTDMTTRQQYSLEYFFSIEAEALKKYEKDIEPISRKYEEGLKKHQAHIEAEALKITGQEIDMTDMKTMWKDIESKGVKKFYNQLKKLIEERDFKFTNVYPFDYERALKKYTIEFREKQDYVRANIREYMKHNFDTEEVKKYIESLELKKIQIQEKYNNELINLFAGTNVDIEKIEINTPKSKIWEVLENSDARKKWGEVKRIVENYKNETMEVCRYLYY